MKLRIFAALLLTGVASVGISACGSQVITGTGGGGSSGTGSGGGGAPVCLDDGEVCSSDAECCGALCDGTCWTEDYPVCGYPGDSCSTDDECCDGPCTSDGTCGDYLTIDCDCACGAGSPPALVCNDPAHPSFCAGVAPVAGGMCETALMTYCGFTYNDIASLGCSL